MKAITFKAQVITARIRQDGTAQIYLRVTKNKKSSYIATGLLVMAIDFDNKVGFCKEKFKDQKKVVEYKKVNMLINEKIAEHKATLLDIDDLDRLEELTAKKIVTDIKSKKLKNSLGVVEHTKNIELYYLNLNRIGNSRQYRTAANSFKKFLKNTYNESDITFKELTNNILDEYIDYLNVNHIHHNTILKYVITLQAAYNKGIKDKKIEQKKENPFENINLNKNRVIPKHRALSSTEIESIKNYKPLEDEELSYNVFLFSYFNRGITWKDICLLKKEDVKASTITYSRKKTGGNFVQSIHPSTVYIVDNYINNSDTEFLFPFIENKQYTAVQLDKRVKYCCQRVNEQLKAIGVKLKLSLPLTTYVARHSYATTLIRSNVNPKMIQNALGHSDLKITQSYINQFNDEDISALNDLL